MLKEKAYIVNVKHDIAWVETQRKTSCGSCQARKSCGTSVLQKVMGNKRNILQVNNPNHFKIGDEVILGLQETALVKGSLLLYITPLFAMFGLAMFGYLLFQFVGLEYTEGFSILFSLGGLGVGFWYVMLSSRKLAGNAEYQAKIIEKIDRVVTIRREYE